MTIAELHGKLSASIQNGAFERMEDLLTSDVFGTMKYAGWKYGFIDWLLQSEKAYINSEFPSIHKYLIKSEIKSIEYTFWPKLPNNREPDLAMCIENKDDTILIILIEAKYFSGTSDWEDDILAENLGLSGNQVADQLAGFHSMSNRELSKWFPNIMKKGELQSDENINKLHLFITMQFCLPTYVYHEASNHMPYSFTIPTYWLSWNSLAKCLKSVIDIDGIKDANYLLLLDLYNLLRRKKLTPFDGFKYRTWSSIASPSFWKESLWSIEPVNIDSYKSFFRN